MHPRLQGGKASPSPGDSGTRWSDAGGWSPHSGHEGTSRGFSRRQQGVPCPIKPGDTAQTTAADSAEAGWVVEPEGQGWGPREGRVGPPAEAAPAAGEFRAWPSPDGSCTDQKPERRPNASWAGGVQVGGADLVEGRDGERAPLLSRVNQAARGSRPPERLPASNRKQTHTACGSCPEHLHS